MEAHPAIPLILEAENTPIFRFRTGDAEASLAVASQLEPEQLPLTWRVRLAHRMIEVLLATRELDRARTWWTIANGALPEAAGMSHVDHAALTVRLHVLDQDVGGALAALTEGFESLELLSDQPGTLVRATRLDLAASELEIANGVFARVATRLEPRLRQRGAFATIDDVWRAHTLLAFTAQVRLDFARAAALYEQAAAICETQSARRDQAEALIRLGQCQIAQDHTSAGLKTIQRAARLVESTTTTGRDAAAAEIAALLANGDTDAAVQVAQKAGIEAGRADDYRGYVQSIGMVTHLLRMLNRRKDAYRLLLAVHGNLKQNLGDAAAQPALALIDLLKADLGDDAFEALAAELLAEVQP